MSKSQRRKQKDKQKSSQPLKNWFNLEAPEITEQLENDLKALHMRSALNPKQHYKRADRKSHLPKHFAVATIQDSITDRYSDLTNKEKKQSFVQELLADEKIMRYQKKRVMAETLKNGGYKKQRFDVKKHKRNLKRRKEKLENKKKNQS